MRTVLVSQRVSIEAAHGERRDALDQAWARLLWACGLLIQPVPNCPEMVPALCEASAACGLLLTGGTDLQAYGGDTPERDATEAALLDQARARGWPVLGVCRGMQLIQHRFGVPLHRVDGHVERAQRILIDGHEADANSFHRWGTRESCAELEVWAKAFDGVVKAVRHRDAPLIGVMWHPERMNPHHPRDIALIRQHFGVH